MSYQLERQHKERRLIFEMEMQNRLYYLWNVNKLVDYSIHSLPTKPADKLSGGYTLGIPTIQDKTADNYTRQTKPQNTIGSNYVYSGRLSSRDTICEGGDKTAEINYNADSREGVVVKACENESSRGSNPQSAYNHSLPTKPYRVKSEISRIELGTETADCKDTIRKDKTADNHNPSQGSHLKGADYTRVEVGRENSADSSLYKTTQTQPSRLRAPIPCVGCERAGIHIPRDINEWLHERTHDLGEYVK